MRINRFLGVLVSLSFVDSFYFMQTIWAEQMICFTVSCSGKLSLLSTVVFYLKRCNFLILWSSHVKESLPRFPKWIAQFHPQLQFHAEHHLLWQNSWYLWNYQFSTCFKFVFFTVLANIIRLLCQSFRNALGADLLSPQANISWHTFWKAEEKYLLSLRK